MPGAAGTQPCVLVADDELQLLRVIARVLERAGYAVRAATDGTQALASALERPGRLAALVLDLAIRPGGAGAVLQGLAAAGERPGVVLTSGHLLEEPVRHMLAEWRGVFLRKPFAPPALLGAVAEVLAARGGARDLEAEGAR